MIKSTVWAMITKILHICIVVIEALIVVIGHVSSSDEPEPEVAAVA